MKGSLLTVLVFILFAQNNGNSQLTIGTIVKSETALDGYTFFSPFAGTKAYMVDNCGNLLNQWDRGTRPGLAAYFLDNGLMMRTYKPAPVGPFTSASNSGGLELVSWNNTTVWSYELNTETELSHHDAIMLPNGNILMLTWKLVYEDELVELGRDPDEIAPQGYAWNERIIEFETVNHNEINIVWEWQIKDHYIQDFDPSKSNYGVVKDHPELFDINLPELNSPNSHSDLDYNHFNAIDYNEDLDQILISVRNSDEIWVIDHSTTTQEAASHSGGRYGKGGDILYRWGNASAYQRGDISEQKLFGQHGTNWITDGEDAGKIMIFNNGNGRPGGNYSTVEILDPDQNADGSYPVPPTESFGPEKVEWIYGEENGENFYSPYLSNAQRLPNGHTLVNSGSPGNIFEIDENKEIVWHYVIPLSGDTPQPQGINAGNRSNFRSYKFAKDFSGFNGINIVQGDPIELNPLPCEMFTDVEEEIKEEALHVFFTQGNLKVFHEGENEYELSVFNSNGKLCLKSSIQEKRVSVSADHLISGIYFLQFINKRAKVLTKKIFIHN